MLTEKQKLYAKARLSGLNQKNSAIAAGYSEKTAGPAACRLEKDPNVVAHMQRLRAVSGVEPTEVKQVREKAPPKPKAAPKLNAAPKAAPEVAAASQPEAKKEDSPALATKTPPPDPGPLIVADDPLEFMRALVGDVSEDPKLRLEAAKALAPYLHAKKGETGKKEERQLAAESVKAGRYGLRSVK